MGFVLQDCEQEEIVFVNDIVTDKITEFQVGDQEVQINNEQIFLVQEVPNFIRSIKVGSDMIFKIK